jgi:peptidoglycan/xylan/chitin deacetylase (PgdA/CDA1 family)
MGSISFCKIDNTASIKSFIEKVIQLSIFCFSVILFATCTVKEVKTSGICLSFDDNYLEQWVEILPLLDEYDAKATFFLTGVGKMTDQEKLWLKQIQEAGHEIGAHGEIHVSANTYIKKHGYFKYWEDEVQANVQALEEMGIKPDIFAYPYGEKNRLMDFIFWFQFKSTRNVLPIDSSSKKLKKSVFNSGNSFEYYSSGIDSGELGNLQQINPLMEIASQEGRFLFLHAHDIGDRSHYQVSYDRLDSLLKMAKANELNLIPYRDL